MKRSSFLKSLLGIPLIGVVAKETQNKTIGQIKWDKGYSPFHFTAKNGMSFQKDIVPHINKVESENIEKFRSELDDLDKKILEQSKKTGILLFNEADGSSERIYL